MNKIAGIILIIAGIGMIIGMPGTLDYQLEAFSKTGVFFGILLVLIGAILFVL